MVESVRDRLRGTMSKRGTLVPARSPKTKFAAVAQSLWPQKTVAELAFRGAVTERAAKHWIAGTRRPSTRILMEIMRELDE